MRVRGCRDRLRYVEQPLPVTIQHLLVVHVPPPNDSQAAALQIVSEYLNLAGTQVASVLRGCPPLDRNAMTLAEFSNRMLQSAALCEGLLELTDQHQRL